jgi:hypothetical protein
VVVVIRWWRQARQIRDLTIRLNAKGEELYAAHRQRESERRALIEHLRILRVKAYRSDRYRLAWTSARRRANSRDGSVAYWRHRADQAETKLHLVEGARDEYLHRLVEAGTTITELRAALDLAVKGNPS